MSWQVRHEGSPNATTGLTPQKVVEGLTEGVWDLSAEVRGPGEAKWVPIEEHPVFEDVVANYEPPTKQGHGEEHLDMNPLIDVALVLLIFFILTTSYDAMRKLMDMPAMSKAGQKAPKVVNKDAPDLIMVKGYLDKDGATIVEVDGQKLTEDMIKAGQLKVAFLKGRNEKRDKIVIDVENVTWDTVIQIIDAGRSVYITKFMMRVK